MIHKIEILSDRIRLYRDRNKSNSIEQLYSEITGATQQDKNDDMKQKLQDKMDIKTLNTDYRGGDPIKTKWGGTREEMKLSDKELVSNDSVIFRDVEITNVTFDSGKYRPTIQEYKFS